MCRAADRLGYLCLALNLSTSDFAVMLDLPLRRAKRVLKPTRKPSLKLIARVLRAIPELNHLWLLDGDGTMFNTDEPPNLGNYVGTNSGTCYQIIHLPKQ